MPEHGQEDKESVEPGQGRLPTAGALTFCDTNAALSRITFGGTNAAVRRIAHDAYQRGGNDKLDQAAERIKALPTGEGDGDGGAIIYDFRAMVLSVLAEMRGEDG